jgi:transcriptional regulator with XRE-family HTH domain
MKTKNTSFRIGTHISYLRRNTRLSQLVVAKALGVDRNTYAKWEAGRRDIKAEYLPAIAQIFGVTIANLFEGYYRQEDDPVGTGVIIFLSEKELLDQIIEDMKSKYRSARIETIRRSI